MSQDVSMGDNIVFQFQDAETQSENAPAPPPAPGQWINIFVGGQRVGYIYHSNREGGWRLTLAKVWGAPRDHTQIYLTRDDAINWALGRLGPSGRPGD